MQQGKKQWDTRKGSADPRVIQPGDTGIWATCAMKKEAKSVSDLRDLFQEVGRLLFSHLGVTINHKAIYANQSIVCDEAIWA